MKLRVFIKNEDVSFDDIEDIVQSHLFVHKDEEELKEKVFRSGIVLDDDIGIGDSSMIYFKYRIEERKLPASVKKKILSLPEVVETTSNIKKKSERKKFIDAVLYEAKKKMPWGRKEYRVFIDDRFLFFVDTSSEIDSNLVEMFQDVINEAVTFTPRLLLEPIVDEDTHFVMESCTGRHKFNKENREITLKGELEVGGFSSVQAITCCSAQYDASIIFTMTPTHINLSPKEFFKIQSQDALGVLEMCEFGCKRVEDLIIIPFFKRVRDENEKRANEA